MEKICVFCKTSSSSLQDQLGKILRIGSHDFHSNCLIFSYHIRQNPDRTKGLCGFESDNIDLALRDCENRICEVCSKPGATVRCFGNDQTDTSCETSFHLPCALRSKNTLHRSYGNYGTYCWNHIQHECIFHCEPITGIQPNTDCCNRLFSCKECIETYINVSEDPFKCPWCRNIENFENFVEQKLHLEIPNGMP